MKLKNILVGSLAISTALCMSACGSSKAKKDSNSNSTSNISSNSTSNEESNIVDNKVEPNKSNKSYIKMKVKSQETDEEIEYDVDGYVQGNSGVKEIKSQYYFVKDNILYTVNSLDINDTKRLSDGVNYIFWNDKYRFIAVFEQDKMNLKDEIKVNIGITNRNKKLEIETNDPDDSIVTYDVDSYIVGIGDDEMSSNIYYIKNKELYYVSREDAKNPIKIATGVKDIVYISEEPIKGFLAIGNSNFKMVNESDAVYLKSIIKK